MPQPLSITQLARELSENVISPLYALIGEEALLRDSALAQLKKAILGPKDDDFNCDVFYGDEAEGAEITSCASEVSVFASRRLVIIKTADKLPMKQCEFLLPYLKAPNESTTIVFIAAKLDGRLKFTQALLQVSVVVDCAPLKDSQLVPWLKQEADRAGVRVDDEALHILKESCGGTLYSARRELEKLASYVTSGTATATDVATLRGTEPGASVFDLTTAIGGRQRGRALAIVARNLEAGEAPLRILGSLAWQYRRLWKVKELIRQGGREGEAARMLRMDPYKIRAFIGQFSDVHLQDALQALMDTDGKLKGGSAGKPAMLLDRLILQLCDRPKVEPPKSAATSRGPAAAPRTTSLSNVRTVSAKRPGN